MIQVTRAVTRKAAPSLRKTGSGSGECSIVCGGIRWLARMMAVTSRKQPIINARAISNPQPARSPSRPKKIGDGVDFDAGGISGSRAVFRNVEPHTGKSFAFF